VLHRALFGLLPDVNVHEPTGPVPPALELGPEMVQMLRQDADARDQDVSGNRALIALLASGHDVFIERGYHNTRVDDLVEAAGVSHGAFYRYFRNKDQLARILTAQAVRTIGATVADIPDVWALGGSEAATALRRWLRRYHAAHVNEAAMLRVWIDGALQDPTLRAESAPLHDWGRRRMGAFLRPRRFGDVDMDAVVMVGLLGVFGARERGPAEIEAAALVLERGLLGR
jgi:AcrR family transcriptional regulator